MNNIQIFNNEHFGEVRVVIVNNEPWWVLKDICCALEIINHKDVIGRLEEDEVGRFNLPHPQNNKKELEMVCINEMGLYDVILRSDKPKCRDFKHWITHEVLPSLRKHGGYINGQENMSKEEILAHSLLLAQSIIDEKNKEIEQKNLKIAEDKPFVEFAQRVTKSNDNMLIRDYAKLLCDEGFNIGEKRLYSYLRNNHYVNNNNMPYQRYVDQKYFFVKEGTRISPTGQVHLYKTTLITPKGQLWLYSKIEKENMFRK